MAYESMKSPQIRGKVKRHILSRKPRRELLLTVKNEMSGRSTVKQACYQVVQSGVLLKTKKAALAFIQPMNLGNKKNFDEDKCWEVYCYLCSEEIYKLVKGDV